MTREEYKGVLYAWRDDWHSGSGMTIIPKDKRRKPYVIGFAELFENLNGKKVKIIIQEIK